MMQILNLYAYVNNNPLIYTDPTGLFLIGIIIGGAIIGGAVAGANRPPSGGGGSSGGNNPIPSMPPPGHNTGGSGSGSGGNNPIPSVPPPNLAVGGSGNNSGGSGNTTPPPNMNLTTGNILGNIISNVINNAINRVVSNAQASNRANSSAQGTATTIYVPVGNNAFAEQRGYIVNGQTVLADGSRIQDGTIVRTASGYYQMTNGSGVRVNRPNNVVGGTSQATTNVIVPAAMRPASSIASSAAMEGAVASASANVALRSPNVGSNSTTVREDFRNLGWGMVEAGVGVAGATGGLLMVTFSPKAGPLAKPAAGIGIAFTVVGYDSIVSGGTRIGESIESLWDRTARIFR